MAPRTFAKALKSGGNGDAGATKLNGLDKGELAKLLADAIHSAMRYKPPTQQGGGKIGKSAAARGDWVCSTCSYKNFSWREACRKCAEEGLVSKPKVEQAAPATPPAANASVAVVALSVSAALAKAPEEVRALVPKDLAEKLAAVEAPPAAPLSGQKLLRKRAQEAVAAEEARDRAKVARDKLAASLLEADKKLADAESNLQTAVEAQEVAWTQEKAESEQMSVEAELPVELGDLLTSVGAAANCPEELGEATKGWLNGQVAAIKLAAEKAFLDKQAAAGRASVAEENGGGAAYGPVAGQRQQRSAPYTPPSPQNPLAGAA